jgi:Bacterial PH domain
VLRSYAASRGPVSVSRYLLPSEVQVAIVRRSRVVLAPFFLEAFGGLLAAITLNATLAHTASMKLVVWIAAGFLVWQLIWASANWSVSWFVITSERLIIVSGLIRRSVKMTPLPDLADMEFERSGPGRIFGYGAFINEAKGQRIIYNGIPFPEQLYLRLCAMLFPASSAEDTTYDDL